MDSKASEAALVAQCRQGCQVAMRDFVARFENLVFGVCLRMLGHRHDAEDVTQEVFVRALRSLHTWDGERPLRPWLLSIAANRCRTHLSQRGRRPRPDDLAADVADGRPDHHAHAVEQETSEAIQEALSQLRDDYRLVFLLFHEQGLSYEEMSELTGTPVGTLKTWLHRARKLMLEYLRERGLVPERMNESVSHSG